MTTEITKTINANSVYYHREYKNDVGQKSKPETIGLWTNQLKRGAAIALPFLTLYKPISYPISLALGATRSYTCLVQLIYSVQNGDSKEKIAYEMLQATLATASCAGTIFASPIGMVLTTGHDLVLESTSLFCDLYAGDYKKSAEHCAGIVNNSLYLAMLLHGGLELAIASLTVQVLQGLYHSLDDFRAGKHLEGTGHLLMTLIRSHQLQSQVKVLQMRWEQEAQIARRLQVLKAQLEEAKKGGAQGQPLKENKTSAGLYSPIEPSGDLC